MIGKDEEIDRDALEELRVGDTRLASEEDLDGLESLAETDDFMRKKKRKRPFLYRIWKFLQVTATEVIKGEKPTNLNLELPQRYRPTTIKGLSQATGFSYKEIKRLYWSFKSECPSGLVNQEEFHLIYSKFFPTGANLSAYSTFIFNAMDHQKTGVINFEDFAIELSVLLMGSIEDKMRWIFKLYDLNKDGVVSKSEIREVTAAIYDLMGHPTGERLKSEETDEIISNKADLVFQMLDTDSDGVVSLDDWMTCCMEDQVINQSLQAFDSIKIIV